MRFSRQTWLWIGGIMSPILAITIYLVGLQLFNNFHEVLPGELYRSAQLSPAEIIDYKKHYGIKTIVNLRGENKGEAWYDAEVAQAKQEGITHIDYMMLSENQLSYDDAMHLIDIMAKAPKPLLIHCQAGANRTSLASALYMAAIKKKGEFESEQQLSLLYGYFPVVFRYTFAMNKSFEELEYLFHYNKDM